MAVERDNPYIAFNFIVDMGVGNAKTVRGGFQEVSGLNLEIDVAEYRNGNEQQLHTRKVMGMHKVGDVTLKRGLIGSLDLWEWTNELRNGSQTARNVTISMMDEAHESTVMAWRLVNARLKTYTAPSLNAQSGTDVAIEEIVLAVEDLLIE